MTSSHPSRNRPALRAARAVAVPGRLARPLGGRLVERRPRALVLAVVVALVGGALAATGTASSASATSYPSWSDVQAAKASQAAQQAKVTEIKGLISSLQDDVAAKQAAAAKAGQAYQTAQTAFDEAALKEQQLRAQAERAEKTAAASESQAGQLAAQLGRSSNDNVTTDLLAHPSGAKDLLYKLGAMSKLSEQADAVYQQASQDRGTAQARTDQAEVAKKALGSLRDAAQQKLVDANAASSAAQSALDAQNDNQARLQAQLVLLTTNTANVQADYAKGVAAAKAEAARKAAAARAAAAAAARAAAAAAASAPASSGSAAGSGSVAPGTPNGSGWVRPSAGYQTSPYGYRVDPYTHAYALHAGVDLAPGCGAPIYAAHAGTVTFAANGGGYGNEVILDNGGGISTAYGHIVDGGFLVHAGQTVVAGQQIALVGSTGWSTGCHLHFETRVGGAAVDPVPFMAARGISV